MLGVGISGILASKGCIVQWLVCLDKGCNMHGSTPEECLVNCDHATTTMDSILAMMDRHRCRLYFGACTTHVPCCNALHPSLTEARYRGVIATMALGICICCNGYRLVIRWSETGKIRSCNLTRLISYVLSSSLVV